MYNDEQLEEDLKYYMRDTTNTLEDMLKRAPIELKGNSVSIDLVKSTVQTVIERYRKSYINITKQMKGEFKDRDTAELASKIEKQIKALQNIYNIELEGEQLEEFIKPINLSRDDEDIKTEEARTNPEKDLMDFMDESLQSFRALLDLDDIDNDIREINKNAAMQSIEIYRTKYVELLAKLQGGSINPNVMLKQSQIEQMIGKLESKYREPQRNILEELESYSTKRKEKSEEEMKAINQRRQQEEQLISFMNDTLFNFNSLLQLEELDSDTKHTIKQAVEQSITIYRKKYEEMLQQMGGFYQNPNALLKEDEIERRIKELRAKYRDIAQPEKVKPPEESIKDKVGDEFKPKTQEQQKNEQEAQTLWMNRLQASDNIVDKMQEGAKKKQEVAKLIQDIEQERRQERNQEIQEENQNQGQR